MKKKRLKKYRTVGGQLPSREVLEKLAMANPLVKKLKPCYQSPRQKAEKSYLCPTCKKTRGLLRSQGKIIVVQGYEQCADCHADICSAGEVYGRQIRQKDIEWLVRMFFGRLVR